MVNVTGRRRIADVPLDSKAGTVPLVIPRFPITPCVLIMLFASPFGKLTFDGMITCCKIVGAVPLVLTPVPLKIGLLPLVNVRRKVPESHPDPPGSRLALEPVAYIAVKSILTLPSRAFVPLIPIGEILAISFLNGGGSNVEIGCDVPDTTHGHTLVIVPLVQR